MGGDTTQRKREGNIKSLEANRKRFSALGEIDTSNMFVLNVIKKMPSELHLI